MHQYNWSDFEEDESSDAIPDKYLIFIERFPMGPDGDREEVACIVHRTVDGQFPLDGEQAQVKRLWASRIVDALNREPYQYRYDPQDPFNPWLVTKRGEPVARFMAEDHALAWIIDTNRVLYG